MAGAATSGTALAVGRPTAAQGNLRLSLASMGKHNTIGGTPAAGSTLRFTVLVRYYCRTVLANRLSPSNFSPDGEEHTDGKTRHIRVQRSVMLSTVTSNARSIADLEEEKKPPHY
jgi:hypothetical protein